ncbi:MAG: hypothetical protein ACRDGM_09930 [bacterium]
MKSLRELLGIHDGSVPSLARQFDQMRTLGNSWMDSATRLRAYHAKRTKARRVSAASRRRNRALYYRGMS